VTERPYLSIGEVLGLLLEEFPDVTISKIRFLESQGLIDPERTASGYRKFYDEDVERLRFILREQKDHYLPLRVIKDRLENGSAPPPPMSGRGIRNVVSIDVARPDPIERPETGTHPSATSARAAAERSPTVVGEHSATRAHGDPTGQFDRTPVIGISRDELLATTGLDAEMLTELETYGLVSPRKVGSTSVFDDEACEVAEVAARFVRLGVEARHLRQWKVAADREVALFEQRVLPLLHQRNPQAREEFTELLAELTLLGDRLHAAMVRSALRQMAGG
jgi:DNA-binding transcriptional MerR regulator